MSNPGMPDAEIRVRPYSPPNNDAEKVEKQIPRGLNLPQQAQRRRSLATPVRPLAMTKLKNWDADLKAALPKRQSISSLALIDDLPIHNRRDDLPSEAPAIVRRVPGFRFRLRCIEGPLLLRIEDGDVRMRAQIGRASCRERV